MHGAWRGNIDDPKRIFAGKVAASGQPAIRKGSKARVPSGHSSAREHQAGGHGTYTLVTGQQAIPEELHLPHGGHHGPARQQ